MFTHYPTFDSPGYLLLLALLLPLWWYSIRGLALFGRIRRWVVISLRTIVVTMIVLALAEVRMVQISEKLTVIYLLDQSLSIPPRQRGAMIEYVNRAIREHRRGDRGDYVGAIVFARDAAVEIPPFDDSIQMAPMIESPLDDEFTNLAGAIKLAQATFPEDAAKRIVIVSDGNQNLGDAIEQAEGVAADGIGIDVVPVYYQTRADTVVERVVVPGNVRLGEPFDLNVVVTNTSDPTTGNARTARGRLVISRLSGGEWEVLNKRPEDQQIAIPPGKQVFTWQEEIENPNFYIYEARFEPDNPEDDALTQNNRATGFSHIRGKGQVLVIVEGEQGKREVETLKGRLEAQDIGVTVQTSDQLFSSLAELQPYDSVVLANVPRVSGEGMDVYHFTDGQIEMLVRNTQQMGAGLVMLGGGNSFGAGGWTGTELEKAMPVDFQIKSAKVEARGALVMIMHACEIPQGNFWQKKIAHEAIKTLGSQDYCGLIEWTGTYRWLWGKGLSPVAGNRQQMMAAVDRMTPSDMPAFDPAMKMALNGFRKIPQAAVKHMIIISDGDPSFANRAATLAAFKNAGITISTVAIGEHGIPGALKKISDATGGKHYAPQNPKVLPRIFQREARRVARPLIWNKRPVRLAVEIPHEMISGLQGNMPPIGGFVMTDRKSNPLAEVHLCAPEAAGKKNSTILASWTYGAGRAVAFTSDTGNKWTTGWVGRVAYDKLFGTMIRWSMRPSGGADEFSVLSEVVDGEVRMIINALDKDDEYINYLNMTGTAVGPDLKPAPMRVEQTAPGRYVATFPAGDAGSYFVAINPGGGMPMIRTGVNVPYSDEFRDRQANDELLTELAAIRPEGGRPGKKITPKGPGKEPESLMWADTFRFEPGDLVKASSSQDIWQYVLMACCVLFFFDVFFRRVQVDLMWVPASIGRAWGRLRGMDVETAPTPQIERLRSRKAEVGRKIEQLRTEARFEPTEQQAADVKELDEMPGPGMKPADRPGPSIVPDQSTEEESYTERLLRAKKKAWKDKNN